MLGPLIMLSSCSIIVRYGESYMMSGLGEMGCDSDNCIERTRSEGRTDGLLALLGLFGTVAGVGLVGVGLRGAPGPKVPDAGASGANGPTSA